MNDEELAIYREMKKRDQEVFIHPSGSRLYAMAEGGMVILHSRTLNLNEMTDEQINQFIIDVLNE